MSGQKQASERDIKPIIKCISQLWAVFSGLVYIAFKLIYGTLHREEWSAIGLIVVLAALAAYYYSDFILPWKEKQNAARRKTMTGRTPGVPARRT